MLTATVTFEPTTPENEAGEAGHDAGFTEGSAMQTSPVAALAWGSLEGSRVLSAARWSRARKVSLIHSENFHEKHYSGRDKGFSSHTEISSALPSIPSASEIAYLSYAAGRFLRNCSCVLELLVSVQ